MKILNECAKIDLKQPRQLQNFPHVSLKLYPSFFFFTFFKKNKYKSTVAQPLKITMESQGKFHSLNFDLKFGQTFRY